ncbi:putative inorganic phosphate cotransporter isoform X2 [Homalodisca vitripennis]|nr:putative inorganic phosphate cotransporter isoform X2 [Homalodisca vitripennis]KAG8327149.1 hypothetical protein J6590_024533 [Homalodisca vitripennis]
MFAGCVIPIMDRQIYFQAMRTMYVATPTEQSKSECPVMIKRRKPYDSFQNRFHWDVNLVRAITQASYIGFLISNVPAGYLADHYGGRGVLGAGVLMGSMATLMLAIFAVHGVVPLLITRLVQGIGQGLVFSSTHSLIAQWAPTSERARFVGIVRSGGSLGWGLGYVLSFMFKDKWKMPFYVTGVLGLIWFFVWYHFCKSKPSQSAYIKDTELQYILDNREGMADQIPKRYLQLPLKAVFSSRPVWSLLFINWAFCYVHYTMTNQAKWYAVSVLRLTDDLTDVLVFAHGFVLPISTIFWGFVSDYLVNQEYMTRTVNRKVFGVTSNMMVALGLLFIPLAGCSGITVVSIHVILSYIRGIFFSTVYANPIDLSPRYAGLIMALLNSTGNVTALFSREMVSVIDEPSDVFNWWFVFLLMVGQLAIMSPPYLCLGSGEVQHWNLPARRSVYPQAPEAVPDNNM